MNHKLPRIKSVIRREETTLRLGGIGCSYHMSWAADDRQYTSACVCAGSFQRPKGIYASRLWTIAGSPRDATFEDVSGYPDEITFSNREPLYYGFGTIALDRFIFQFLGVPDQPVPRSDGTEKPSRGWLGAKLIFSPDQGKTWCNQDGSTPVVWESIEDRSRRNMVFFEEPQNAFSLPSVLQMGRNYEANCDGYVYVYAPNGNNDGMMDELIMFRVPKGRILNRAAYEYFTGLRPDGGATWSEDIRMRAVVHKFPRGRVGSTGYAWQPSVAYNAPLGVYLMANWGWDYGVGALPTASRYLGLWIAHHPWGPWAQIHEETVWIPANDPAARPYAPQIAPKWIANDGRSFWLVWSDYRDSAGEPQRMAKVLAGDRKVSPGDMEQMLPRLQLLMPYLRFNTQRVDLVLE